MPLPGVKVGPLDPDATSQFGQVSAHNSARSLIRKHAAAHPPILTSALGHVLDPARTKGLDLDEVKAYVSGLKRENGDPMLPEGCTVVGAAVRGEADRPQILSFTFETPSRRTAKWFAPYTAEALPESYAAGTELRKVKEMRDRGVVAFDDNAAETTVLRREAAELRRQNDALRDTVQAQADGTNGGSAPAEVEGDTRPAEEIAEDESGEGSDGDDEEQRPGDGTLTEAEPIEGYDELNAHQAAALLKGDDITAERIEAIVAYERKHGNRKTVVAAGEQSLDRG